MVKNDTSLNYFGVIYTTEIKKNKEHKFNSLSYFEGKIDKAYELRVFYFNQTFYPMAIFSQNDKKTKIDFRNYNRINPNRTVPFELPIDIKDKLSILMNILNLNSGSVDLIVSKDREYYFLEVNPVGQFGMVSHPCNFNIEEIIAKYLLNEKTT